MADWEKVSFDSGRVTCAARHYRPDFGHGPYPCVVVAHEALRGEVKHYPVGHFDVYPEINPDVADIVIADQIAFLHRHLLGIVSDSAPSEAIHACAETTCR